MRKLNENCGRQLSFLELLSQYFTPWIVYFTDPIFIAPVIGCLCLMSKLLANTLFPPQIHNYQTQTKPPKQFFHTTQKKFGSSILELNF